MATHLVVFDLDGTLISSARHAVGDQCFWRSLREILCLSDADNCWVNGLKHVTARCIASQLCEDRHRRALSEQELSAIIVRYVEHLADALSHEEARGYATQGAAEALRALEGRHPSAIATGCFRATAETKLRKAGLYDAAVPLVASDALLSREEIMLKAHQEAQQTHGRRFERVTYVGDGPWDVIASNNLGWSFVGIGSGKQEQDLRAAGATSVLPHFRPIEGFLAALADA